MKGNQYWSDPFSTSMIMGGFGYWLSKHFSQNPLFLGGQKCARLPRSITVGFIDSLSHKTWWVTWSFDDSDGCIPVGKGVNFWTVDFELRWYCWWFRNPANSPVEVIGSWNPNVCDLLSGYGMPILIRGKSTETIRCCNFDWFMSIKLLIVKLYTPPKMNMVTTIWRTLAVNLPTSCNKLGLNLNESEHHALPLYSWFPSCKLPLWSLQFSQWHHTLKWGVDNKLKNSSIANWTEWITF